MLKLKLVRLGKTNFPFYRLAVMEENSKLTGHVVDSVGYYNPMTKEKSLDDKKIKEWLKKGAQLTNGFAKLWKK
jgi:small subunit ribosomal protein S16